MCINELETLNIPSNFYEDQITAVQDTFYWFSWKSRFFIKIFLALLHYFFIGIGLGFGLILSIKFLGLFFGLLGKMEQILILALVCKIWFNYDSKSLKNLNGGIRKRNQVLTQFLNRPKTPTFSGLARLGRKWSGFGIRNCRVRSEFGPEIQPDSYLWSV